MKIDKNTAEPVYLQIKEMLSGLIDKGEILPDQRFPSENEIGARHKVNRLTARRALVELEKEGRIYTVPGKGRFLSNPAHGPGGAPRAATKRLQNARTIGVYGCLPELSRNPNVFTTLFTAMVNMIHAQFGDVKFLSSADLREMDAAGARLCEGVLAVTPMEHEMPLLRALSCKGIPVVAVNRAYECGGVPYVAIDQYSGAFDLASLLIENGHKKFCVVAGHLELKYMRDRERGVRDAARAFGLPDENCKMLEINDMDAEISPQVEAFLRSHPELTAVFLSGEVFQQKIMAAIAKMGLKVPGDISAVAIDETVMTDVEPQRLTCVRQPMEEMATRSLSILSAMLEKGAGAGRSEILRSEIVDNKTIRRIGA